MKKADNFNASKWLVENKITTQSRLNENESFQKPSEDLDIKNLKKRYYGISPKDLEMISSKQDSKVFTIGSPEFDADVIQLGDYIKFSMDNQPDLVFQADEKSVNAGYDNAEYSKYNRSLLNKMNREELSKK
jgi:hypothetical protein